MRNLSEEEKKALMQKVVELAELSREYEVPMVAAVMLDVSGEEGMMKGQAMATLNGPPKELHILADCIKESVREQEKEGISFDGNTFKNPPNSWK